MAKQKLPSTAVGRRRLLKLAKVLEADAKNKKGIKFDLSTWAKPSTCKDHGSSVGYFLEVPDSVQANCDTAACAVGLACVSGAFKRAGLGYRFNNTRPGIPYGTFALEPTFKDEVNFVAVQAFFGTSFNESNFLFDPERYPKKWRKGATGERFVAKRIRKFVSGKATPDDL